MSHKTAMMTMPSPCFLHWWLGCVYHGAVT